MSDARDPAIKIFGRTIPLPESELGENPVPDPVTDPVDEEKDVCRGITNSDVKDPMPDVPEELDQGEPACSSDLNNTNDDDHQNSTQDDKMTNPKPEQGQSETDASGQEKVLKKPDKILPCPRCNSLDTKFCYYNNYNFNQPRHFCKNCQRYWTAGGTMRNVPVGAGRRKTKYSGRHQALSGGLSAPMRPLKGNGTVLKFGPEAPLCEPIASVLNIGDQKRNAEKGSVAAGENGEEPLCASAATASNCSENDLPEIAVHMEQNGIHGCCSGVTPMHHLQFYPGPPWPYPWGPGWNNVAAMAASHCSSEHGSQNPAPWSLPQMLAAPAFCAPTVPFPFMPASFWTCMSSWPNGAWNVPWVGSNGVLTPSSSTISNSVPLGNGSPTLGKHSRDGSLQGEEKIEKSSLWVPKTLRIDDPDEAAKSSIWATLGIKPDESIKRAGMFRAFQSKTDSRGHTSNAAQISHANPAARSRSQTFQEST